MAKKSKKGGSGGGGGGGSKQKSTAAPPKEKTTDVVEKVENELEKETEHDINSESEAQSTTTNGNGDSTVQGSQGNDGEQKNGFKKQEKSEIQGEYEENCEEKKTEEEPRKQSISRSSKPESSDSKNKDLANGGNDDGLENGKITPYDSSSLQSEIASLKSQLTIQANEVSFLNKTIDSNKSDISRLKLSIKEKDDQIASLSTMASSATTTVASSSDEILSLKNELLDATAAKENAEEQYESLLEKISHIKSTLGARLKSDAEELSAFREKVNELEADKKSLSKSIQTLQQETISANKESDHLSHELSQLRSEFQTKIQEWSKEREILVKEKRIAQENSEKSEAMVRDLEIAIADDHSLKENANFRISGLEEQIISQTNYAERYRTERDQLKLRLQETEKQLESKCLDFSGKLNILESENQLTQSKLDKASEELSSANIKISDLEASNKKLPLLEDEVKEKVLLIGKLRHEAVILNEHLTKALRMIKRDSEGETVDKLLITNLLLSFLSFPRGDAKKFEVLQLISNFLNWDEDQKAQAGLTRQHGSNNSAPPRRSQSSNSLTPLAEDASSAGRFMGLFAEFLERESSKRPNPDASTHT